MPHRHEDVVMKVFDKTLCVHCSGTIEFPIEGVGQEAVCPHCRLPFTLPTNEEIANLERFNWMRSNMTAGLIGSFFRAITWSVASGICVNAAAFFSSQTLLGFLIWPWAALMVIAMQYWIYYRHSKRQEFAAPFYWAATLGIVLLVLFWYYLILYEGVWSTLYHVGKFGFFPSWQKFIFAVGGICGLMSGRNISTAERWIKSLIRTYEELPVKPA